METALQRSHVADLLMDRWSWGSISTPFVQEFAAMAVADGVTHEDCLFLGGLGSDGKYPNNMYSELCRKLVAMPFNDALDTISIWQKKGDKRFVKATQKILLPHRAFACLYANYPDIFKYNVLGGSPDEPNRFWDAMASNPSYKSHPVSKRRNHKTHCVPIGLHGDGVQTSGVGKSWAKGCDAYSWRSLLSKNDDALTSSFFIFLMFGKLMLHAGDMHGF